MSSNSRNSSNNNNSRNNEEDNSNSWVTAATVGAGLAAVAGGLYWWATRSTEEPVAADNRVAERNRRAVLGRSQEMESQSNFSTSSYLSDLMSRTNMREGIVRPNACGVPDESIPEIPLINNLDTLLHDIYLRYIALKRQDFRKHYRVFDIIFQKIHQTMKKVDRYYRHYSSTVQVAGSHFDRLRIKKPDEFDIDIFIGLPLNLKSDEADPSKSDIILESMSAGFVKLKMGTQFQKLPFRENWETNKTLYSWKDDEFYLLRSKFSFWFKSLVYRALNEFDQTGNKYLCHVDNVPYVIDTSEAGPAVTLKIKSLCGDFKMDVDLVPVLKFPEERWPVWDGYRKIPQKYSNEKFMVVPKPIKGENSANLASRSWRMSLVYQENKMLYDTHNLRLTIKFLKKLRDTLGMNYLASYYIKTLLFWEVSDRDDPNFWRQAPSKLFTLMVKRLHAALSRKEVLYFWNDEFNLIEGAAQNVVAGHVAKLARLITVLDNPAEYKKVALYLLTVREYEDYARFLE